MYKWKGGVGWGEGFGAGGGGTVKKMGVPSNAILFFIYLFILFYEMGILTRGVTTFNLISIG